MKRVKITGLICFALVYVAVMMLFSEWYYNDHIISSNLARVISGVIVALYCFFFYKFYKAAFDQENKDRRSRSQQNSVVIIFVIQSILSVEIVGLLMFIFGGLGKR